ncbi:MAG: hypothetical protein CL923_06555 [Deltaproteobacteria bacterium]|nr:hypothetical protein [Deltaproteobacteria bacterium]
MLQGVDALSMIHLSISPQKNVQMNRTFFRLLCVLLIHLSVTLPSVFAENDPAFEQRFRNLSDSLRCPTCQGISVKDSQAGFSTSMKLKIRELMNSGLSDEEIRAYFVERYGEWILRAPPKQGFNLLLWGLPGIGLVVVLGVVLLRSKRWVRKEQESELLPLSAEEETLIAQDLRRFERSQEIRV